MISCGDFFKETDIKTGRMTPKKVIVFIKKNAVERAGNRNRNMKEKKRNKKEHNISFAIRGGGPRQLCRYELRSFYSSC